MRQIIGILFIIVMLSCQEHKPRISSIETEDLTSKQIDSIVAKYKFQYESPIVLDSTNQVLIPISTELPERRKRSSKIGYYSDDYPRYWNILFYNRQTGETRLLTEDKIRISQIYASKSGHNGGAHILYEKVLYEIADIDFNKDNRLNAIDPEYLFASESNGTNFKRVSPKNEDLLFFQVIPNSEEILIQTRRDSNSDSIFNRDDESIWYKAEFKENDWKIEEIIDSTKRKRIKNLYYDQWLKNK